MPAQVSGNRYDSLNNRYVGAPVTPPRPGPKSRIVQQRGFDPRTQVPALHVFWADDPDWTNPGNGNPVDSWRNHTGGGDVANVGTARPLFVATDAELNDHASIAFTDRSLVQNLQFNITNIAQPFKMVVVFRVTDFSVGQGVIGTGNGAAQGFRATGTQWVMDMGTALTGTGGVATGLHVARLNYDTVSSEGFLDGTSFLGPGTVGVNAFTFLSIGARNNAGTPSLPMLGAVAFVGIYDGATTSDADLIDLADDLRYYYTPVAPASAVGKSIQLIWNVNATVGKNIQLIWDVLENLTAVGKNLQLVWDVRSLVGKDIQLVWDLLETITIFRTPVGNGVPWSARDTPGQGLMRNYGYVPQGITVWQDINGEWHEQMDGRPHPLFDTRIAYYQGGRVYVLSDDEVTNLLASPYAGNVETVDELP